MKPRILMLGWEFPPVVNGGLGVACFGLARALAEFVDLRVIVPVGGAATVPRGFSVRGFGGREFSDVLACVGDRHRYDEFAVVGRVAVRLDPYAEGGWERNEGFAFRKPWNERTSPFVVPPSGVTGRGDECLDEGEVPGRCPSSSHSPDLPQPPEGGTTNEGVPEHSVDWEGMLSSGNVWLAGGGLYGGDLGAKVVVFSELVVGAARRRGWDFGIIHAHDWMTFPAALALRAASGRPLVVHIHSLEFDRAGGRRGGWIYEIERRAMEAAERVVPVSRYTAGIIERDYGIDSAKIRPVHNGVEPVAAFRSEKRFPEPLVLFVGRLTGQKGPEVFVEIAARVAEHNPNVRFAMAGEGEKLARLLESRSELGLDEKFHFTGFLDREGVRKLYSMADVYCMPSLSEPFGLSALEAAQFGVPVVLSKQSGAAEVLDGALLADGQDAETMARHIDRLLGDERLRAEVVGRQRSSLAKATWETAARGVGAVYREMVG